MLKKITKIFSYHLAKKNSIVGLSDAGVALTIVTVTLAIGAYVISTMQNSFTANSTAFNISNSGTSSIQTMGNFLGIVAIALVFSVVIALLFRGLGGVIRGGSSSV